MTKNVSEPNNCYYYHGMRRSIGYLEEYKSIEHPGKLQVQVIAITKLHSHKVGRFIRNKFYPLQYNTDSSLMMMRAQVSGSPGCPSPQSRDEMISRRGTFDWLIWTNCCLFEDCGQICIMNFTFIQLLVGAVL